MEIITVIKIGQNGELCTYAYSTLEKAIEVFPVIQAYHEILHFEISLPYGMTINNRECHINVKKCFIY